MRTFSVKNDAINQKWVSKNLDSRDYEIKGDEIVITYFNESQKKDILQAISETTYDVVFNDDTDSNSKGFESTFDYCKNYILAFNGSNHSYFADYKGGIVQIVCNETEEVVYEEEVR